MSKSLRVTLIVLGVVVGASVLLLAGFTLGRSYWGIGAVWPGSMMAGFWNDSDGFAYGPGMMGSGRYGPGMMGGGMMGSGAYGPGMMGTGRHGPGMMGFGVYGPGGGLLSAEPLTLEQAQGALQDYLASLDDEDLLLGEIMIFDNHAYAEIVEASTGIGAMEVLVDPSTLQVYPEHGPNMMWNLKYSPMLGSGGYGMMGSGAYGPGMMGWYGGPAGASSSDVSADMPVSPAEAVEAAQRYLDRYLTGTVAADEVDPFYGYYTLHILRDGTTIGMLSVNGYSEQVFLHTWHGDFIEMSED